MLVLLDPFAPPLVGTHTALADTTRCSHSFAVLEPAAQALQMNLLGVRDEELRVLHERQWQHELAELNVRL